MMNKSHKAVFSILLAIPVIFFVLYSMKNSNTDRHIRFNGSFVLIDQESLFKEVEAVSVRYNESDRFLSEIKKLLFTKKYINNFSIRHSWPNEVIISIEEIAPLALIDGKILIADDCTTHEYPTDVNGKMLVNFLVDPASGNAHTCHHIKEIISYLNPSEISRVEILANGNYRIFMGSVHFIISGIDISAEMQRFADVSQVLRHRRLSVDLRYFSGGAIRPL